jgi:hypothetical protein
VKNWLNNLRLSELIPVFLKEELYLDVLTGLDEEDIDKTLDSLECPAGWSIRLRKAILELKPQKPKEPQGISLIKKINCCSHGKGGKRTERVSQREIFERKVGFCQKEISGSPVNSHTTSGPTEVTIWNNGAKSWKWKFGG